MFNCGHEYRSTDQAISIYNSLGGKRVALDPLDSSEISPVVSMYVCGLTPQDRAHLGHALMGMRFDIVRRYLQYRNLHVRFVQNVTDVDDKIIAKVISHGVDPIEMTRRYTDEFYLSFKASCSSCRSFDESIRVYSADYTVHSRAY